MADYKISTGQNDFHNRQSGRGKNLQYPNQTPSYAIGNEHVWTENKVWHRGSGSNNLFC